MGRFNYVHKVLRRVPGTLLALSKCFLFACLLFKAAPVAYGSSQAKG